LKDTVVSEIPFHPISEIFPLLKDEELQRLADDIRENGLHEEIWLFEGKILDGRNRALACQIAGVTPRYRPYTGTVEEAIRFVLSANLNRRHLLPTEKYEAIDKANCLREEAKKRQQDGGKKGSCPAIIPASQERV
jgi:ParB-like chromosome segregation protein Spo0J